MLQAMATPLSDIWRQSPEGSAFVGYSFNFVAGGPLAYSQDFQLGASQGFLTSIKSVWIDNSTNNNQLTLSFGGLGITDGNTITVAPNSQGFYPVLCPRGATQFNVSISAADNVTVQIALINEVLHANWNSAN